MEFANAIHDWIEQVIPVWSLISYPVSPLFIFFSLSIFPFRFPKRYRPITLLIAGIACGAAIYFTDQLSIALFGTLENFGYLKISLMSVVMIILFSCFLFRGNHLLIALTALLLYNLFSALRFVFLGLSMRFLKGFPFESRLGLSLLPTILLCVGIYLLITRVQKNALSGLEKRESILWFFVAALSMVLMCLQSSFELEWWQLILNSLALILTTSALYALIFLYSRQKFISEEQKKLLLNRERYEGYLDQLKELDAHISTVRHEVKNHVFYLDQLVKNRQYEELQQYINRLKDDEMGSAPVISTGNTLIDSLVNQKCGYAHSLGIATDVTVTLPEAIHIPDIALCSILGNLLTNAIEGCEGIEHARISLAMAPFKDYLLLTVKNTVSHNVIKDNPHLQTTKEDPGRHGIGLKVVEQLAAEYAGTLRLEMADPRTISASVMLKNTAIHAR